MSTIRVNTLATVDDSFSIAVDDLATNSGTLTSIANYSTLKTTIPTIANKVIFLEEYITGTRIGGGSFISVSGSATDNGGTICVPTGSSSFYWQRIIGPQNVTPEMFGVVPGSSAYAAANTTKVNAMLAAGIPVLFSDQTYYFNGKLTSAINSTVFLGMGMGATNLRWVSTTSGNAGFYLSLTADARSGAFNVGGFTVWSDNANSSTSYAISIDGIAQLGTDLDSDGRKSIQLRKEVRGRVHDIQVSLTNDSYSWARAFSFVSLMNFSAANLHGIGSYSEGTVSSVFMFFGGDGKPTDVHMDNIWAYFYNYFVMAPDYSEGLHLSNFEMVHCNTGIYGDYLSGFSTLTQAACGFAYPYLDNGHINAINNAIQTVNCEQGKFTNLTLFVNPASTTDNVTVVNMKKANRCAFNGVSVMGWGAANTKFNNNGIVLNDSLNCTVNNVHGWSLGNVVKLTGASYNNVLDDVIGFTCNYTIGTDGTPTTNVIGAGCLGNGNTTSAVQSDLGTANAVAPKTYGAGGNVAIGALATQAYVSISIPIPAGYFGAAPDFANVTFGGEGIYMGRYLKANSSATSLTFSVVNLSASSSASVTTTYSLICGAGAGRKQ